MPDKRTNQAMNEPVNTMRAALLCAGIGVVCGGMLGGCRSDKDYYSYKAISGNLTPELQGISERQVDVDRNLAVNQNADIRLMWSDLGRVWFTDNPSTLSPLWTVSTSGQPY